MNARRYLRRSGVLLLVAALVIALVGAIAAPDNLGRGIACVLTLLAMGAGLWRLREAALISPTAIVREVPGVPGRLGGIGVEIEEPTPRDESGDEPPGDP
jgi:hypothetical protein